VQEGDISKQHGFEQQESSFFSLSSSNTPSTHDEQDSGVFASLWMPISQIHDVVAILVFA